MRSWALVSSAWEAMRPASATSRQLGFDHLTGSFLARGLSVEIGFRFGSLDEHLADIVLLFGGQKRIADEMDLVLDATAETLAGRFGQASFIARSLTRRSVPGRPGMTSWRISLAVRW